MKKFFSKYMWLFEMIAAALLLGLGLIMKFIPSALLILVGLIFFVLGALRIIPLVKTTDDKLLKILYIIELAIEMIAGVVLFIFGAKGMDDSVEKTKMLFGYIIAGIIYIRGFVYLLSCSFKKEKAHIVIFMIHIGLLTLASVIFARGGFTLSTLGWVLLAISVICAFFVGADGVKKYTNYRHNEYAIKKTSDIKVEEKEDTSPTSDEITIRTPSDETSDGDTLNA